MGQEREPVCGVGVGEACVARKRAGPVVAVHVHEAESPRGRRARVARDAGRVIEAAIRGVIDLILDHEDVHIAVAIEIRHGVDQRQAVGAAGSDFLGATDGKGAGSARAEQHDRGAAGCG